MSEYSHTIVFGFPNHWFVMANLIKNNALNDAPNIISIKSVSIRKVFKEIKDKDVLNNVPNFKFIILRKTSSKTLSPKIQKSDKIYELDSETMQYIPFDIKLLETYNNTNWK